MADEPASGSPLGRLISTTKSVAGVLSPSLLIYGVVRVAHDAFYVQLKVTAEEAGLSQAVILGRAVLYFILFLLVLLAAVGAWIVAIRALTRSFLIADILLVASLGPEKGHALWSWERRFTAKARALTGLYRTGDEPQVASGPAAREVSWILFGLLTFVLLGLPLVLDLTAHSLFDFLLGSGARTQLLPLVVPMSRLEVSIALWVLLILATAFFAWRSIRRGSPLRALRAGAVVYLVTVIAAASLLTLLLASERGRFLATEYVMQGYGVQAQNYALLAVLARPVCVDWIDPPFVAPQPFVYLGQANGLLVLYDYHKQEPIRIPDGKAILDRSYPVPPGYEGPAEASLCPSHLRITGRPRPHEMDLEARFTFISTRPHAHSECSLDASAFTRCESPITYDHLLYGRHIFEVRSVGRDGVADPLPATWSWTIFPPGSP